MQTAINTVNYYTFWSPGPISFRRQRADRQLRPRKWDFAARQTGFYISLKGSCPRTAAPLVREPRGQGQGHACNDLPAHERLLPGEV